MLTEALRRPYAAILVDMDGTILTSVAAAERAWTIWAQRHHLDFEAFLPTIHGVQAVETIRNLALPGLDPSAEAAIVTQLEIDDVQGVQSIGGAQSFLASLPPDRWAVVTSAPRALASRRLTAAGLAVPLHMITAEDVRAGKPAPECFLLAATRLGVSAADCLVFEDSPAGIAAADAAGATVIVITAAHRHPQTTVHPTLFNFEGLTTTVAANGELWLGHSRVGAP
jgi:sugar-phosphatase